MTEEIIIDGVDVAGCQYATKSIPIDCENNICFCYEEENCYYKQLKRLEQKNFELEESLKVFNKPDVKKVLTLYNCGEITRLEQELNDLQDRLLTLADTYQETRNVCKSLEQENKELIEDNLNFSKENKELKCELEQLRQSLKN